MYVCVCVWICVAEKRIRVTRVYTRVTCLYTCICICTQHFSKTPLVLSVLSLFPLLLRTSFRLLRKLSSSAIDIAADRPPIDILFNDPNPIQRENWDSLTQTIDIQRIRRKFEWGKKEIRLCFRRNTEFWPPNEKGSSEPLSLSYKF